VNCGGGHAQAIFDYDTPWLGANHGGPQIYWQKQPGTSIDDIDVTWSNGSGASYRAHGDLREDRTITLTPTSVTLNPAQSGQAILPSLGL
jgi:hypothetical protein